MKWPSIASSLTVGCAVVFALAAAGCAPSNKVAPGAPHLVEFSVLDPMGQPVALVTEAGTTLIPPLSQCRAIFDRLLDATVLETIGADGGPNVSEEGIAKASSDALEIPVSTFYTPNGHHKFFLIYPPGPSIVITPVQGFPSGSTVSVALEPTKVRSQDQRSRFVPNDGVSVPLTFDTEPLAATLALSEPPPPTGGVVLDAGADEEGGADADADADGGGDAGADAGMGTGDGGTDESPGDAAALPPAMSRQAVVVVSFNNFTADATAAALQATATVAGVPIVGLEALVARDTMVPTAWTVSPPASGWPPGALVTVTVGINAVDNFQKTLGAPVSTTFMVVQ